MGNRGRERQDLSKTMVGRKTDWAEFAGLCVRDEIMADLIMDPHYIILALLLSDWVAGLLSRVPRYCLT